MIGLQLDEDSVFAVFTHGLPQDHFYSDAFFHGAEHAERGWFEELVSDVDAGEEFDGFELVDGVAIKLLDDF